VFADASKAELLVPPDNNLELLVACSSKDSTSEPDYS
jgi:hypothetical protein